MNGLNLMEVIRKAAGAGAPFARDELAVAYDYGNLGLGQDFEKASDHLIARLAAALLHGLGYRSRAGAVVRGPSIVRRDRALKSSSQGCDVSIGNQGVCHTTLEMSPSSPQ
jgi:hypothetical protein